MTPEQQLIEGVLRGAVGHYTMVDLHALCKQAEEALAAYRASLKSDAQPKHTPLAAQAAPAVPDERHWNTPGSQHPERLFAEWLNDRRGMTVSEVFHEVVSRYAAALAAAPTPAAHELLPVLEHFAYDPENGIEFFKTAAEAEEYANESIKYYREGALFDGEWSDGVDSVRVGVVTRRTVEIPQDEDSCDYQLCAPKPTKEQQP